MFSARFVLLAVALLAVTGCSSLETTTRTGTIHDVIFDEHMTPNILMVQAGDEVRWVNQRATPVELEFLDGALDDIVCRQGFTSFTGRRQESSTVKPNESVSLCFSNVGTVTFNARMASPVAGGVMIESGTIRIRQ